MSQKKSPRKNLKNPNLPKHHDAVYRAKHVPIRLAHHKHTGKRLPFYCTSYAIVFFILIFTSSVVLFASRFASADQQSGTVQLTGKVNAKPPEIPAKITSPPDGSHFTESQVDISGTCLQDTYVEIYRKNIFAGMTICSSEGNFKVTITLTPKDNLIIAKTRDNLGQYGPDSSPITLYLDQKAVVGVSSTTPTLSTAFNQPLLIYTDPVQKGLLAGQALKINYEIDGNEPPYTVVIDWGDGTPSTLVNHAQDGDYSASHIYKDPGQHTVRISGIGSKGSKATIQTIVVVYSSNVPVSSTSVNCQTSSFAEYCFSSNRLTVVVQFLWPAVIVASLMAVSFWIGEKITYSHMRPKH